MSEIKFSLEFSKSDLEPVEANFDSDEDIDADDDWNELESDQEPTKCLFCDEICSSIERAIEHLEGVHHIDLSVIKQKFNLDQYSYIKVC